MKRVMAMTALAGLITMLAFAGQSSAQEGPAITADPATVTSAGEQTFTVKGTGYTAGLMVFVVTCKIPGADLSPATSAADLAEALGGMTSANCDAGSATPATVGDDGTFTAEITANVGTNFALAAGDAGQQERAAVAVLITGDGDDDEGAGTDDDEGGEMTGDDDEGGEMTGDDDEGGEMTGDDDEGGEMTGDDDGGDMTGDDDGGEMTGEDELTADEPEMDDDMDDTETESPAEDMTPEVTVDTDDGAMPDGGVASGLGGTATDSSRNLALPAAAALIALALAGGAALAIRRNG